MVKFRTYLICRIIFTFLFLVSSTIIWFTRDTKVYYEVKSNIDSNVVTFSNLKRISNSDNTVYNLKIENKIDKKENYKVYIVSDVLSTNVSNNYIKYQINDNRIKTLNMDGMIIASELDGLETKDINLKLWISDTYTGNLNYSGRIVVS